MRIHATNFVCHRGRRASERADSAFTMVEIALCLGIVGFALVAIIGVLPTGLKVQKQNLEDTVINQDGTFLLEAIRSGSVGLHSLTNSVEWIRIGNGIAWTNYLNVDQPVPERPDAPPADRVEYFTNGFDIVGLLTTPKYVIQNGILLTNHVSAMVRSIAGVAMDKAPGPASVDLALASARDLAFRYLLTAEMVPLNAIPPQLTNFTSGALTDAETQSLSNNWRIARNQAVNFNELRLTLQGPAIVTGTNVQVFGTPKSFRTILSGFQLTTPDGRYSFVQPSRFVPVGP